MLITLYSKPNCPQCDQSKKVLGRAGIDFEVKDVTEDPEAHAFVVTLGYSAAPVVYVSEDQHWSGFRPDRIRALASVG